ncbi:MAG: hypothetical protein BGN82_04710 [Alphaproteobacteria bacterium 65-7]|nr:MAG: hypothetical protein BGN82_04710 [Alphaproteobacteria bacterium 65-7]
MTHIAGIGTGRAPDGFRLGDHRRHIAVPFQPPQTLQRLIRLARRQPGTGDQELCPAQGRVYPQRLPQFGDGGGQRPGRQQGFAQRQQSGRGPRIQQDGITRFLQRGGDVVIGQQRPHQGQAREQATAPFLQKRAQAPHRLTGPPLRDQRRGGVAGIGFRKRQAGTVRC